MGEMAASGAVKKVAVVAAALCALLVLAAAHGGQLPPDATGCLKQCYEACSKPVMDCVAGCGGDLSCKDKCPTGRLSTCRYECNHRCFGY